MILTRWTLPGGEIREWVFSLPVSYNWGLVVSDVKVNWVQQADAHRSPFTDWRKRGFCGSTSPSQLRIVTLRVSAKLQLWPHALTKNSEKMHCGWRLEVCVQHKGCRMPRSFSSEHNKGHPRHRKRSDVFRWQPSYAQRFRCLLSLFRPVPSGGVHPPLPWPTHASWTVSCCVWGKAPHVTWLGTSIVRKWRQEVEWRPDLSADSLNIQPTARPSHCQQAQLGWARGWLHQWGSAHICDSRSFPSESRRVCGGKTGRIRGECGRFIVTLSCDQRQKYLGTVESQHTQHVEGKRWNSCPVYVKAVCKEDLLLFPNLGP